MTDDSWLIDESRLLDAQDEARLEREMRPQRGAMPTSDTGDMNVVLSLHDVVIHDTRKWFGDADIRLDMLVTTGRHISTIEPNCFVPQTQTFPRIRDGDMLQIGPGGLIGFLGVPAHFLDVSIIVSRDRQDVDSLAKLLAESTDGELHNALGTIGELVASPHLATVKAGLQAAGIISNAAYRILRALTGATVGLYRNAHLQYRDGFGIGRHPTSGSHRRNDLSFYYVIDLEG